MEKAKIIAFALEDSKPDGTIRVWMRIDGLESLQRDFAQRAIRDQ